MSKVFTLGRPFLRDSHWSRSFVPLAERTTALVPVSPDAFIGLTLSPEVMSHVFMEARTVAWSRA